MECDLNPARQLLLVEKNAREALDYLAPMLPHCDGISVAERKNLVELAALAHARLGNYDRASEIFMLNQDAYQAGYCQMLQDNMDAALDYWKRVVPLRNNHWCVTLYGLVTGRLNSLPTFLQIRNHMEADIMHLCVAGRQEMVRNIIKYVDLLSDINYEAYKFAGRALMHSGQYEEAERLLLKGQKALPNDPEIYYHLGQFYHIVDKPEEATLMLKQCLLISSVYLPARRLLQIISGSALSGVESAGNK